MGEKEYTEWDIKVGRQLENLDTRMGAIERQMGAINDKLDALQEAPASRWNQIVNSIISSIVGAAVTACVAFFSFFKH